MENDKKIKKILLIENQWMEFEIIAKELVDIEKNNTDLKYNYKVLIGSDGDIYMDEDKCTMKKYALLADAIRIWVNAKYDLTNNTMYRDNAFNGLEIIAKNADLIIMDHILGGSCGCRTGIDLAEELVEKIGIDKIPPVLFLSKTENNDKKVLDRYENNYIKCGKEEKGYKNFIREKLRNKKQQLTEQQLTEKVNAHTMWVHKGYFGDEILQPEYIRKYVIEGGIEKLLEKHEDNSCQVAGQEVEGVII